MGTFEPQVTTATKLKRRAWLSSKDPRKKFTALMHYFNEESLGACFHELRGGTAVGVDGLDKEMSPEQIAEATELARKFKAKNIQDYKGTNDAR